MDKNKTTEEMVAEANKEDTAKIPGGYIEVKLSSRGQLGAPETFHVRNLGVEELMDLSLSAPNERPIKVVECLQAMVWEKDVKVRDFHEKEVIELLILIYYTFYNTVFQNIDYEPDDEDWDFLANQTGGKDSEEYTRMRTQYANKQWAPKFDLDLNTVQYFTLPENFKKVAKVTKKTGFTCAYSYPCYGDVATMRDITEKVWAKEDAKFASLRDILQFRRDAEDRIRRGETINYRSIPNIPKAQQDEYYEYEKRKANFIVQAVRGLHLVEYKGKDVSHEPIEERIRLAKDYEIDGITFEKISKHFEEMQVGINPIIKVRSPIQEKIVERRFPFRVDTILQCLRDSGDVGTTVQFV